MSDLDHAREFLDLLDPDPQAHHFQTFDDVRLPDGKKRKQKKLVAAKAGTLDDLGVWLEKQNSAGAGVYFTVGVTDGKSRTDDHIIANRAVWGDFDQGCNVDAFKLPPSVVITTSKKDGITKKQCLWLTDRNVLTREETLGVVGHIAHTYNGDLNTLKYCQVLRLPGFHHMKDPDDPQMVRFSAPAIDQKGLVTVYTRSEILDAFPPRAATERVERDPDLRDVPVVEELDTPLAVEQARSYLATATPAVADGTGDGTTYRTACRVRDFGISQGKALEVMMEPDGWNERCDPPWEPEELEGKIENAWEYAQNRSGVASLEHQFGDIIEQEPDPAYLKEIVAEATPASPKKIEWAVTNPETGKPVSNSLENVEILLEHFGLTVRLNDFSGKRSITGLKDYQSLNDDAFNVLWAMAQRVKLKIGIDALVRLTQVAADKHRYHPVLDYLRSLKWDGVERVDTWLSTYCGAEDTPLHREFARLFLVAAAKRVLQPGCKFDYMLVLQGKQGVGKSTVGAILGGEWYGNSLRLGSDPKETVERTRGRWIVELAELAGMASREIESIKDQITTQVDGPVRPAYGRVEIEIPRQWIMLGTTNSETPFKDRSGNRRFLPVVVHKVDFAGLLSARDQLLAEAYVRALRGESLAFNPALETEAEKAQAERVEVDPIKETFADLLEGLTGRVTKDDLWMALGASHTIKRGQREQNNINAALKELGWEAARHRHPNGRRYYCFEKSPYLSWLTFNGQQFVVDQSVDEETNVVMFKKSDPEH